ncbi:hypothetical protein Clacol_001969 [Clathrus columnatus]|uniref:Cytochrome P450 n=1 Tax=Clathrus columnatus TaxID=1419009 RepID=A0AAV5A4S7_9AGAM|nr:hypothetical protein Clacol_001969 [Clathrus columnatus]
MFSTNFSSLNYSRPPLLNDGFPLTSLWTGSALLVVLLACSGAFIVFKPDPYAHIPAVGGTNILSVYLTVKKFYFNCSDLLAAGYDKYGGRIYRIPDIDYWHIIVSRPDQTEELRKAPEDVMSSTSFFDATFFFSYLMGPTLVSNMYHMKIIRSQLTKNLSVLFDDLQDEIHAALDDIIPLSDDWTPIYASPKVTEVVARVINRVFVGLPINIGREPEYLKANIDLVIFGMSCAYLYDTSLVAKSLTTFSKSVNTAAKYLGPIIKERQDKMDECGHDYPGKPFDALSWLMEEAVGQERSVANLTKRVLALNFAAVNTTSASFTFALYTLAAEPYYLQPMREEIERVIAEEGWTKTAMTKMHNLDSFLKESMRFNMGDLTSFSRMTLKEFTFSDGTFIPKGCIISATTSLIHYDEEKYPDSKHFDGFRFAKIRAQKRYDTSNQLENTSPEYIPFGHGRHACPGRFLAATVLKAVMAYIILNYDVKLGDEGVLPKNLFVGTFCIPDPTAKVMFRRRRS